MEKLYKMLILTMNTALFDISLNSIAEWDI